MIIHVTTVHPRTDTRIRLKEVATLARLWPGEVALFVQDGKGDEEDVQGGFTIHDTGAPESGRLRRMIVGAFRMYRAIRQARPRVAHFHDPELLPWAMLLHWSGISVIYDAHEDLPAAVLSKPYIDVWLRRPVSAIVGAAERVFANWLTQVVTATPSISRHLSAFTPILVQNYPLLSELQVSTPECFRDLPPHFAYVGGISAIRSAVEMVAAIDLVEEDDVLLQMAGTAPPKLNSTLRAMPGWKRVVAHGWADRSTVAQVLSQCRAGLVLYQPEPNHVSAQPNKLFEYMAAGLPVIASDFPLWREIVDGACCGLLVDPKDPKAIAHAMQWILDYPAEAAEMGRRGRAAVEAHYNWEAESEKLVALYRRLLPQT